MCVFMESMLPLANYVCADSWIVTGFLAGVFKASHEHPCSEQAVKQMADLLGDYKQLLWVALWLAEQNGAW